MESARNQTAATTAAEVESKTDLGSCRRLCVSLHHHQCRLTPISFSVLDR